MITVLAFLLTLGVLIVVHEYGHYRVAVACGVKVLRFSVGFGRVIWRRQATPDSTEFVVSMLPLGGYVRMLDEREAPVDSAEVARAFNRQSLWKRSAIVAAGPIANLLLAVVLYAGAFWIGMDEPKAVVSAPTADSIAERSGLRAGDWVRASSPDGMEWTEVQSMTDLVWHLTQGVLRAEAVHLRVADAQGQHVRSVVLELDRLTGREVDAQLMRRIGLPGVYAEPIMGQIKPNGPAEAAGLRAGDRVLSVDGRAIADAASLRELVRASGASARVIQPQQWLIERGSQRLRLEVEPVSVADGEQHRIGRIEAFIGGPPEMVLVRHDFFDGLSQSVTRTVDMAALTLKMFGRMVIGEASLKNLTGPLTIADYAGQSVRVGLAYYLGFLAVVSISLGVLNLLPLPMLDGGHLMYHLFEATTGRPVPELWLERLQRGGVAIMLMLMSIALFNDVVRLVGLP
ncbi:MAG: RIP metalloprotease RseP [Burkholderiaceae bacterium]|nr:RIP metalloprotease RseP [Burkholderiaceae bacterium]